MKKAILVGINIKNDPKFLDSFKELEGLAKACEYKVVGSMIQNLKTYNKGFALGVGKIESLRILAHENEADVIVFNNELSPLQAKNLEDVLEVEVIDRTILILNIFASRARSREAKLQVEVARYRYLLPRLSSTDANYEQQSGGGVVNRGAGEKKIDIDKRILKKKISILEKELDDLAISKDIERSKRVNNDIPLVSIVGYTNAGKSTLLNAFLEEFNVSDKSKEVFVKDMLFATLDTTTRLIRFKDNKKIIMSDTVGFISDLPTELIRAFRSTLEEINNANLIILVADISNPEVLNHIDVTLQTLDEIGIDPNIPIIYVFNKADKVGLATLGTNENKVFISAKNRLNLNLVENEIKKALFSNWKHCKLFIPYTEYKNMNYLNENATIISRNDIESGTIIEVELSPIDYKKFNEYLWVEGAN